MTTTTTDALDLAIQQQALDIELALYNLLHGAQEPSIPLPKQGGLERPQHEPHKLTDARSTRAPATNPNAAAFDQVHTFPKGRWS